MGRRSIVLWRKWTGAEEEIREVLSNPRGWAMVRDTLVALIWICMLRLFPKPLGRRFSQK
jgi:hypothetical protein